MKNVIFFLFFLGIGNLTYAENNPPSLEVIKGWWKNKSNDEITARDNKLLPIFLKNNEAAFLIEVHFFSRGRNFTDSILMVRPKLREVKEIEGPFSRDVIVHDLNHDGISEVETVSLGSGQGTTSGVKSIVQFDGWKPVVLHKADFFEGCGFIGENSMCSSTSISWKFADLNGDGIDDLIEEISTIPDSPEDKPAAASKAVRRYIFNGSRFIKFTVKIEPKK